MGDLIYRLLVFLNSSKDENINFTIATTMINNIKNIPSMSINKLADLCYTSPAAISRFCRKLGYSNLSEFKQSLSLILETYNSGDMKAKGIKSHIDRNEILNTMHGEIINQINETKDSLDLKVIDLVIELIHESNNVCFFGTQFSQLIAQDFQTNLAIYGKIIHMATDVQDQERIAEELEEGSLAILVSPTGRFINYHENLWNKIKNSKAIIVSITQNRNNKYKNDSNYIVYFGNESNIDNNVFCSNTKYALSYLLEYILIRYGNLYSNY